MKEALFAFMFDFTMLFAVISSLAFLDNHFSKRSCENYETITGKKTKWFFMDSCYIETENGW